MQLSTNLSSPNVKKEEENIYVVWDQQMSVSSAICKIRAYPKVIYLKWCFKNISLLIKDSVLQF